MSWSDVGTEDSKHIPSPGAPVNTELRLIVYRGGSLTRLGKITFHLYFLTETLLISVGER